MTAGVLSRCFLASYLTAAFERFLPSTRASFPLAGQLPNCTPTAEEINAAPPSLCESLAASH
jgi:hypothetical protein